MRTTMLLLLLGGLASTSGGAQHPPGFSLGLDAGRSNADEAGTWAGGVHAGWAVKPLTLAATWTRHWRRARGTGLWSANLALLLTPPTLPLYLGAGVHANHASPRGPSESALQWGPVGILGLEVPGGRLWPRVQLEVSSTTPGGLLLIASAGVSIGL